MIKKIIISAMLISSIACFAQSSADSLHYKMFISDRDYFMKLQETVPTKNQYIGLQWCIDLLNKYIELEEKKIRQESK
ncbi:MAG: hypothetical protein J0M18_12585 [Ignavibacteria bacterium]|jgi:hypothetical protein|nr:hypothetical protein [Ignavibacteria bacterium]